MTGYVPELKIKEVEFDCEKHGKVLGHILVDKDFCGVPICPKCEEENKEKERLEEETEKKVAYEMELKNRNIEPEYWGKELADYIPRTSEQEQALNEVQKLIEQKKGKLVLLGSNGVGKTFLGSMAVKALGGKILSMYEISTMIRQSYSVKAEKSELEIVKELASIPMLVIDEIGRTKGSEAELNWLSYVLDKRHTRDLPFMILTNTHLSKTCSKKGCDKCFERFFNNDILSRLRQAKIITINAPDYRAGGTK